MMYQKAKQKTDEKMRLLKRNITKGNSDMNIYQNIELDTRVITTRLDECIKNQITINEIPSIFSNRILKLKKNLKEE